MKEKWIYSTYLGRIFFVYTVACVLNPMNMYIHDLLCLDHLRLDRYRKASYFYKYCFSLLVALSLSQPLPFLAFPFLAPYLIVNCRGGRLPR